MAALDCGPSGEAIEAWGPPANRVNFGIIGDGYTQAELGTIFKTDLQSAMTKRFSAIGQPYLRYRKFINICAFRVPSTAAVCAGSALGCCGNDQTRLATCDTAAVNAAFSQSVPSAFMVDWRAVMLNSHNWWNTAAVTVLWSGGHQDAGGAALHYGAIGFHQLSEENLSTGTCPTVGDEVNVASTADQANARWGMWLGFDQNPGTGVQDAYGMVPTGCATGFYRSSNNSMMNSLFGSAANTSFNSISREKIITDIWRHVVPVDSVIPPAGALAIRSESAQLFTVNVIDPDVIRVDWSVDGAATAASGMVFNLDTHGLAPGVHMLSAQAYDNAGREWIRHAPTATWGQAAWARSSQTVTWTVTVTP